MSGLLYRASACRLIRPGRSTKVLVSVLADACLLWMVVLLASCSSGPKPADVLSELQSAYNSKDVYAIVECFEPNVKNAALGVVDLLGGGGEAIGKILPFASQMLGASGALEQGQWGEARLTEISTVTTGDRATVRYHVKITHDNGKVSDFDDVMQVVKVDGEWYISAVQLPSSGSQSSTTTTGANQNAESTSSATASFFTQAHGFSDGVAWVQRMDTSGQQGATPAVWECIDGKGKTLFSLNEGEKPLTDFNHGCAVIQSNSGAGGVTIVDTSGKAVFPKDGDQYIYIYHVSAMGDTVVSRHINTIEKTEEQMGVVDSSGAWIVEPLAELYRSVFWTRLGDSAFGTIGGIIDLGRTDAEYYDAGTDEFFDCEWGDFDSLNSRTVDEYLYHEELMFLTNNNMAQVLISPEGLGMASSFVDLGFSANKTGFYDRNKKLVIDLSSYGSAYPIGHFSGGYCTMQLGNPQGSRFTTIIDKSGNPMFEPLAGVSLGRFSQGRATKSGGASGFCYINASGEEVITGLEEGSDFAENGLALVKRRGEPAHCFIDVNGNRLGDSENPAVTNATGLASGAPSAVAASKTSEVTNATQPGPAQSKVLYEIDNWSPGSEWTLGGGWTIANSILVSDGSGHWSAFAPFVPSRSDYAVEAEVRIRAGDPSFQLLVRTVPDSANYSGGYDALSGQSSNPVIEFGSEVLAGSNSPAPPSDSWHTIRLEANGTSLRLVIDGVEVAGAVDTRLSEPGAVGLWFGDGCRVDVRSFRVIAI